jgi:hypothetical protein
MAFNGLLLRQRPLQASFRQAAVEMLEKLDGRHHESSAEATLESGLRPNVPVVDESETAFLDVKSFLLCESQTR